MDYLAGMLSADLTVEVNRMALTDALTELGRLEEAELLKVDSIDDIGVIGGRVVSLQQTAEKLENLRQDARPVILDSPKVVRLGEESREVASSFRHDSVKVRQHVYRSLRDIYVSKRSEALRLELVAAARERREASTRYNTYSDGDWWRLFDETRLGSTMAFLAWPEMAQWIREDDARRLSEYEEFRKFILGECNEYQ